MATLTGNRVKDTYKDLLQVSNGNAGITADLTAVSDGEGHSSKLELSTAAVNISSAGTLQYAGVAITSTAAELNILDGATVTVSELNILDGVTATTAEINLLDGVTATTSELNILDGVTSTASELNILDGVTSTTAELNILDGVTSTTAELNILDGVTATASELNILDGVTATASELNIMDGVTATTAELNYVDGVTSNIQTQLDSKISATLTQEQVEDFVGGMLDGTETGISVTYDDTDGNIDFVVATQSDNNFTTTLKNKLDAIEASADVTDTSNVTSAGALMDSEVTNLAFVKGLTKGISDGNVLTANDAVADNDFLRIDGTEVEGLTVAEVLSALSVESGADVTDATNVTAAGALMDSEVTDLDGIKSLTVPNSTTISTFGASLVDDANAGAARTTLGVDASGTDNSTNVTLVTSSHDYLSLSGQAITLGTIDISDDTNLSAGTNISLSGDTLNVDDAFLINSGNDSTSGTITAAGFTTTGTLAAGLADIDDVVINGTTIGHTDDTDLITLADGNVTIAGELDLTTLDVSGDADIDGTLEADAITVGGTALNTVIAGVTVANATLASTVTITDKSDNVNYDLVFGNSTSALYDDTGALYYNPSTGTLRVPNLNVAGTTTQVDTVTMNAENAVVFEGATADGYETTLTVVDPTADRTINLPNVSGTLPVLAAASTTQISATPAELNVLDGVTAGTVSASLGVVVDSNKDIGSFRNITLTGELDAGSLDVSGDVDIDGTLETDALSINGTTVSSTAAELNILDGVTSTAAELNVLDGITAVVGELNALDLGSTAVGTAIASKAVILDSNKDYTGLRNFTITGELDAATLDVSGNADIDGTLEADAITVDGTALNEYIADTVGAMVGSNTETGITVTYEDGDNTLDFVVGTLNQDTTGNAATATALETARTIHGVSFDGTANIDLSEVVQDTAGGMFTGNTETFITATYQDSDGTVDLVVPVLDEDDLSSDSASHLATQQSIKAYIDAQVAASGSGDITAVTFQTDTGSGSKASDTGGSADFSLLGGDGIGITNSGTTITAAVSAAQTTITSLLATDIKIGEDDQTKIDFETADEIHFYAANTEQVYLGDNIFGPQSDSDVDLGSSSVRWKDAYVDSITVTGEVDGASLDISGNADIDGTLEADAITVNGTALNEYIADTIGDMVGSNTESGITVAYQDSDNTLDFTVGTLNQDTTGTAANATHVTVADNESTDENNLITFIENASATGNVGLESDGDFHYNPSSGTVTATVFKGNIDAVDGDFDGTLEADAYTVAGTSLAEYIADTVGAMFSGNTETRITATYQDGDNTIDLVVDDLDTNTTYSAGNGISLSSTTFAVAAGDGLTQESGGLALSHLGIESLSDPNADRILIWDDSAGAVAWATANTNLAISGTNINATDTDTNTTYSAGTNISLSGTTFNVDDAFLKNDANDTTSGTITAGGFTTTGSLSLAGHAVNDIDVGSEFVDADDHLMTSGAIKEKIESYGYTTNTGDMTGVDLTGANGIAITSESNTGSGAYSATVNISHLGIEDLSDPNADRILIWDDSAGAVAWATANSNLAISGTNINATDTNTNTTYSAGSGIALSSTTFSVAGNTGLSQDSDGLSLSHLGIESLSDPGADRILIWDDSAGAVAWATANSNLAISGTNINATDTNTNTTYSAGTNISLSGTTFNVDDAFLKNDASDTMSGSLTVTGVIHVQSGDDFALGEVTNTLRMKGNSTNSFNFLNNGNGWAHLNCGNVVADGSIEIGGHSFDDIDIGSEFVDTDDHIMSSGAIKEKIESYGYVTTDTNTTYSAGTNLSLSSTTFNVDDAFLKNDANDTTSGTITAAGFNTASGKVGDVDDEYIDFGTAGEIQFKIDNVEDFMMADGGTFHANADIIAYSSSISSDKKLKKNIKDVKYGLEDVLKLRGVEFDWKEKLNGKHDIGFIAQEIEEVVPELVKEVDGLNDEEAHLVVDYAKLVPVLVESIKELKEEIDLLSANLDQLKYNRR